MSYSVFIAYALTFIIPLAIVGLSYFASNIKGGILLAWVSFVSFCAYYNYKGLIENWVLVLIIIVVSLIFMMLFNNLLGGGSE